MTPLNILHVLRTPVGGLFRHVRDLAQGQAARGHRVGLIADSGTGGAVADALLRELAPALALGVTRTSMPRQPGPADLTALVHVMGRIAATRADVLHGHGAKGGTYARLAPNARRAIRVYTPHGGSLHYSPASLSGRVFLGIERALARRSDLLLFESAYSAETFAKKIGPSRGLARIVHNGVAPAEFEPVATAPDASDLLFIGELRALKGIDVLIDALTLLRDAGRPVTLTVVGDGPDRAQFVGATKKYHLDDAVVFAGAMPARQAFARGRLLIVPSRAESLPYVVLEAAAAGIPMIATYVGGIPEIFGSLTPSLVPPEDARALAEAIGRTLDAPEQAGDAAAALGKRVAEEFSVDVMVEKVLAGYAEALARRHD
jgi:glycosyltransferase involved in cell wall biosynthesis